MNLSDKLFGSNVDKKIRDIFYNLQKGSFQTEPLSEISPTHQDYLGDKTPFARMWTAVNIKEYDQEDKDSKNIIYTVNENKRRSYEELESLDRQRGKLKRKRHSGAGALFTVSELQDNEYLKPTAGITGITSKSEGAVGALRRTTVDFVVHNKVDFDEIFLPFFLRPGTTVFVDFGWSDETLKLYDPIKFIDNRDLKMSKFYENLYDSENGEIAKQKGFMSTLNGLVTKYDVTVDEKGSFKCNLEFVSQNYSLVDKEINDDNDLKFLFTNVMDEILVNYVAKLFGVTDALDFDLSGLRKLDDAESNEFVKAFFDTPMTSYPGLIDTNSKKSGVFYQNLSGMDDYLDSKERLYISFGLFEDLFLNNFISWWEETLIEGGVTTVTQAKNEDVYALKYRSKDSWVRYDNDLFALQQKTLLDGDELTSFLYPDSWDIKNGESETYNKTKPKLWKTEKGAGNTADDIKKHRIPLRELFISIPVIQEAFSTESNINDVLEYIFDKIWEDSTNIINIKMISHNDSQRALTFQDANLIGYVPPVKEMLTFDLTSGNSVVLDNDLKFETPKAGLASMIAIKNQTKVDVFTNLDDLKLSFFNVLESMPGFGNKKILMKSLPDVGFIPERKKVIDMNLRKLFQNMSSSPKTGMDLEPSPTQQGPFSSPTQLRYNAYKENQTKKLEEIKSKETGKKVVLTWKDFSNLPKETKEDPPRPIKYARSYRHKKLLEAKIKNFLQSGENTIAPVLPITLSLTIYGNNFLGIGDYITVNFLPNKWQDRVFFQIVGVDHSVDMNMWKTIYSTVMRIKPNQKIFLTGNEQFNLEQVKIEYHPLFSLQVIKKKSIRAARSNRAIEESFIKVINDTGEHVQINTKDIFKAHMFNQGLTEKYKDQFAKFVEQDQIEFIVEEMLFGEVVGNINTLSVPGQELKTEQVGPSTITPDHYKLYGIGQSAPVTSPGQLAWLIAVSDFLLSDKYLKWDKYADTFGNIDEGKGHLDMQINSMFGMDADISDLRRDTMSISTLFTGNEDNSNQDRVTWWTKHIILGGFDKYVQEWGEWSLTDATLIDSVQREILNYINTRPTMEVSEYIKTQYEDGDKIGGPLNEKPILKLLVWGLGIYKDIYDSIDGEIFVNISCTNEELSDFKSFPDLIFPKRLLKDNIAYDTLTLELYSSYLKHKILLMNMLNSYENALQEYEGLEGTSLPR